MAVELEGAVMRIVTTINTTMGLPSGDRIVSYNDKRLRSLAHLDNMLRLRPSELTLTPDDVEETFRRIALRQTSRARTNLPLRPTAQSGRPILRRGPQRSTRDAITALGSIPILQPQQATFTSVEEEEDIEQISSQEATPSTEHDDIERPVSPIYDREAEPAHSWADSVQSPASPVLSLPSPESPPRRTMHLPFRFGRSRRPSTTQAQPDAVVSVSRTPTRPPFGHARLGSTGTSSIGDTSNSSMLSSSGGSTKSTSGLRGGGDRVRDVARDPPHAPSPLHQMQRLSSPAYQEPSEDPTKSPTTPHEDQPTLYLEGYWHHTPEKTKYRIRESTGPRFQGVLPHSEPRRGSHRQASVMRSSSSDAAPVSRLASQARLPSGTVSDDVFGTPPAVEPPARGHARSCTVSRENYCSTSSDIFRTSGGSLQPEQTSARSRHFSSDASGTSAQFSYYGSLASSTRFPSSEPSLEHDLSRLQLDGAAASNESHHLSTSAVPLAGTNNSTLRPNSSDSSVYSSPGITRSGPHGVSPLPSMPYTRNQGDQASPSNYTGNIRGGYIEAVTAVVQGLESPLDPFAEHYQRQLQAQHAQQAFPAYPTSSQSRAEGFQARRSSHGQGSRSHHPIHVTSGPRTMVSRQPQHQSLRSIQPSFEHLANPAIHGSQLHGRSGRGEQRSGENDLVVPSLSQGQIARNGRVQAQRAAYERLHNPGRAMQVETEINPFRHSMPQTTVPYDRSNRPRDYAPPQFAATGAPYRNEERSSSPFITHQQRRPSQGQTTHPLSPPRVPTRQGSRQLSSEVPQRAPTRAYRPVPGARYLNPSRDSPLTALALDQGSGTTSRRSYSPLIRATTTARTHRRIPPEQRDQENDGDRSLMRREEENVNARYGEEEQQRGTMNETPPRIGRVERRMQD